MTTKRNGIGEDSAYSVQQFTELQETRAMEEADALLAKAMAPKFVAPALGEVVYRVYAQEWEESEAGWGTRPDGFALFKDVETYGHYMRNEFQPGPYDCYTRKASEPRWIEVTRETFDLVHQHGIYGAGNHKDLWPMLDPKTAEQTMRGFAWKSSR